MIGEIPAVYGVDPAPAGPAEQGASTALQVATDSLELRLMAAMSPSGWGGMESIGWGGGWGGSNFTRCPPALIMSTAALRCRVVILDHVARARPIIRDRDTKKEYTGEFATALAQPMGNEDPGMSLKRWVTVNVSSMLEQGDAHIWKSEEKYATRYARNGKRLRRAYIPLPVASVEPMPGRVFWKVEEWIFTDPVGGQIVRIPPEELARIEYLWNPRDYFRGIGPMEACKLAVETDYWYAVQARNRQAKGGLPQLLLMNQRAGVQDQELKAFLAEFRRQMADERGGVAGLGSDWKVERLSMTSVEADEINSRRYQVEEIARAHGIPLIDLGVYDSTGFGREGMAILNRMRHTATIEPLAMRFADGVTAQIIAEVDEGLEFAFDWSAVQAAQADLGESIGYAERLFALGVPMEEAARLTSLALEDYNGKDLGFLASSLLTMEEIQLRLDLAKNPPPPPPQLAPFAGPDGQPPDVGSGDQQTPDGQPAPPDGKDRSGGGQPKTPGHGEPRARKGKGEIKSNVEAGDAVSQKEKDRVARTRARLEAARLCAAVVLPPDQLDQLEARATAAGISAPIYDRLIAKATPSEIEASLAYQRRLQPYSTKISKIYETGVNRAFKEANSRLWKLQNKRKKIRLLPGEPVPEGQEVYTDSKGEYYFGAIDPTLVDPIVENIGLDTVIDQILDQEGEVFDEGVDSMRDDLKGMGYLKAGATIAVGAIALLNSRRQKYLDDREKLLTESTGKIEDEMRGVIEASLARGEDLGTASDRLMEGLRPKFTGGDRARIAVDGDILGTDPAPGRAEMWGDEEAFAAANAARALLADVMSGEIPQGLWWRWITMDDPKVRPAHEDIHGDARPVGQEFIEGASLRFPRDPACKDASLTVNCRCWTVLLSPEEAASERE